MVEAGREQAGECTGAARDEGRREGEGTSEGGEADEPEGESAIERERLEFE